VKTLPPYLIRESDGVKFILTSNDTYIHEDNVGDNTHLHSSWTYDALMYAGGFLTPEEIEYMPTRKKCFAWPITIFMAGPIDLAKKVCQAECDREGLCVTVEPTTYIYTGDSEEGFRIGLINYARFPATQEKLLDRARKLARLLLERCGQTSFSIVTPETSYYYSTKDKT